MSYGDEHNRADEARLEAQAYTLLADLEAYRKKIAYPYVSNELRARIIAIIRLDGDHRPHARRVQRVRG